MPLVKPEQLFEYIKKGELPPLLLLDGPETWGKEKALLAIQAKFLPGDLKDFNLDRLYGGDATAPHIIQSAQSLPFLAQRRVVIVNDADELSKSSKSLIGQSLENIPSTTLLVFIYDGKADKREEIPMRVNSAGMVVTFWPPFPNQMPRWVSSECQSRGRTIQSDAAQMIADTTDDLQTLSHELDKLVLYIGNKKNIDVKDVREFGLLDTEGGVWDLEEALWRRNLTAALQYGKRLLEMGARIEMILPVFERTYRKLFLAFTYLRKGNSQFEICTQLAMNTLTKQSMVEEGLRRHQMSDIADGFEKIIRAEWDYKTGRLGDQHVLTLLLVSLLGGTNDRSGFGFFETR